MKLLRLLAVLMLLLLPAWTAAAQDAPAAPAPTISTDSGVAKDTAIRRRITEILNQFDVYRAVNVRVDAGVVTLSGKALDAASVERLQQLTSRVDGVVEVNNEVTEETNLRNRLQPVLVRMGNRLLQFVAFLPLLAIALFAALLIGLAGNWVSRRHQPFARITPNPFIAAILRQMVQIAFWLGGAVVALDIIGATALLGTLLGAAGIMGIALSFAVRDTVENFVASIMLSMRQPFRPNDRVEIEGNTGRVLRLTSRATTLLSADGNHIRIPNSTVFKARIVNYSRNPERRFVFDLGVDGDIAEIRELALRTLRGLDFVLPSPQPAVWVKEVGESNVEMRFTGWVTQEGSEFDLARGEAIRQIKVAIEQAGYGLPEPIYRVNLVVGQRDGITGTLVADEAAAAKPIAPPEAASTATDTCPPPDLTPDKAIDRLVAQEAHPRDAEPNLLSADAPQE